MVNALKIALPIASTGEQFNGEQFNEQIRIIGALMAELTRTDSPLVNRILADIKLAYDAQKEQRGL